MNKRLIIYDVDKQYENLFVPLENRDCLFSASPLVKCCIGCFGCWIKTPGVCVIRDRCTAVPSYMANCNEMVVISPILYGGYSQKVKAVMDRSIGYLLPYFRIVNGEMHHQIRYNHPFRLCVYFYGACSDDEKNIAKRLVEANAVNLGADRFSVMFLESVEAVREVVS